jgi:dipeptidase E
VAGHVIALGGGGFSMEPENPLLDRYILSHARRERPSVCFVGTASGDAITYVTIFYRAFARLDARASDLSLFERDDRDLRDFVLDQDVIYVGGGNTANLLAIWRLHGLDAILREALDRGAVLCGISAGMNCWFEASTTDSFGPAIAPLHDGLGFVPGSACPHYDGEPQRRPVYRALVDDGFPAGHAADDGAALRFSAEGELVEAVASRPHARAYRVEPGAETPLPTRYLG